VSGIERLVRRLRTDSNEAVDLHLVASAPQDRYGEEASRLHALAIAGLPVCRTAMVATGAFVEFVTDRDSADATASRIVTRMQSLGATLQEEVVVRPSVPMQLIGLPDIQTSLTENDVAVAVQTIYDAWLDAKCTGYRLANQIRDEDSLPALLVQANVSAAFTLTSRACATGERTTNENVSSHIHNTISVLTPVQIDLLRRVEQVLQSPVKLSFAAGPPPSILRVSNQPITPIGYLRFLLEFHTEEHIDDLALIRRIEPEMLATHASYQLQSGRRSFDGLPLSPGAAVGRWVVAPSELPETKEDVIVLFDGDVTPEDLHRLVSSVGAVGAGSGMTSHLALVARGFGKPAVGGIDFEFRQGRLSVRGQEVSEPFLVIDGTNGVIQFCEEPRILWREELDVRSPSLNNQVSRLLELFGERERFAALSVEDQYHIAALRERLKRIGHSS